jgi:hypothetical protein
MTKLQAAIAYEQDNTNLCKSLLDACPPEDADIIVNQGCVLYKEGDYDGANRKFMDAMQVRCRCVLVCRGPPSRAWSSSAFNARDVATVAAGTSHRLLSGEKHCPGCTAKGYLKQSSRGW